MVMTPVWGPFAKKAMITCELPHHKHVISTAACYKHMDTHNADGLDDEMMSSRFSSWKCGWLDVLTAA